MKRRNKPSVYDQVDAVLDPFITAWGPPDPDDCVEAKKRILEVLDIIKDNSPSEPYCGFGPNFIYLPRLQQIYFLLLQGNYPEACNELFNFIHCDWRGDSHEGLILLLEEFKAGKI